MAKRRYVVKLTSNERKQLQELIRKGKSSAKHQLKARASLPGICRFMLTGRLPSVNERGMRLPIHELNT
jgi:hypothetical protein